MDDSDDDSEDDDGASKMESVVASEVPPSEAGAHATMPGRGEGSTSGAAGLWTTGSAIA